MRVVLDTAVLVAGLRSDRGASRVLLEAAFLRRLSPVVTPALFLEYEAVLSRAEHLVAIGADMAEIGRFLDDLLAVSVLAEPRFLWRPVARDPADDMLIEAAMSGGARALVTFNVRDLRDAGRAFGLPVLTPREVLRWGGL